MNHDIAAACSNSCSGEEFGICNRTPNEEYCSIVFPKETSLLSELHQLNKTSSTRSKNCDSHQKWLHPEINNNILLLTLKHQNFGRFLFQRSANFFFCFVYDFLIEQQYFNNRLRKQKFSTFNSCWILSISCHFTDFYNIKGQYLKAQTDCHIKRMEQEPCTYPMPILISLAFLMGY